ncbi:MAG: class I SAM-dependent methyltransferase [Dehalococcoidia bacterium]|nr:class I SAM-dependent methyltransferase [Dehalococcoidia bacterium]
MTADPALSLTHRRPDRFATVRESAPAHRLEHGCDLDVLNEVEARELAVMVRATHSSYVLELGTGIGYSGLHIAASFGTTGRLDTIESDPRHARMAAHSFAYFALDERTRVHTAPAEDVVPALSGPYDLLILDAAWVAYPGLYEQFIRLLRTGGSLCLFPREGPGRGPETDPFLRRLASDDRLLPWFAPGLQRIIATRVR